MNTYLILYGAENDLATFEADTPDEAVALFCDWAPVGPDFGDNYKAVNSVLLCTDSGWAKSA